MHAMHLTARAQDQLERHVSLSLSRTLYVFLRSEELARKRWGTWLLTYGQKTSSSAMSALTCPDICAASFRHSCMVEEYGSCWHLMG